MMEQKHLRIIDFVILGGTVLVLFFLFRYAQPYVIAPVDELVTTETDVLFDFENANSILIDDNSDFTSPDIYYTEKEATIKLKPGLYYWKVQGAFESEIRTLTIQSEVALMLRKSSGKEGFYEIVNVGNTNLEVEVYKNGTLEEIVSVGVSGKKETSGEFFVGGEDE